MSKTPITQQQRDNALFARDVMWPAIPEENIIGHLGGWRRKRDNGDRFSYSGSVPRKVDCKTVACFGGWIAVNPYFQAQGVSAGRDGAPMMKDARFASEVAVKLFGEPARTIFGTNSGTFPLDDRDAVTQRLNELIHDTEVK